MRINPDKVPNSAFADKSSKSRGGINTPLIQKQRTLSVQDVRDYSTPQGAAMANEEMRRLRLAVNKLEDKTSATSVDQTKQPTITQPLVSGNVSNSTTIINNGGDSGGGSNNNSEQDYTVYHNYDVVGIEHKNVATNYIDTNNEDGKEFGVKFLLEPVDSDNKSKAKVKASVFIPQGSDLWYAERFYTDKYFPNLLPASVYPEVNYRFSKLCYHDVVHNFNLSDMYAFTYSIYHIQGQVRRAYPVVIPIDKNTIRVYSHARYGIDDNIWFKGNTNFSIPNLDEGYPPKDTLPEYVIVVHSGSVNVANSQGGSYGRVIDGGDAGSPRVAPVSDIKSRRDTAENWIASNPILLNGEMGVEINGQHINVKVGDGIKQWIDLEYVFQDKYFDDIDGGEW